MKCWAALLVIALFPTGGTALQDATELVVTLPLLLALVHWIAPSVRALSHSSLKLQLQFGVEHPRQLPRGHPVPHRERVPGDEALLPGVAHRPANRHAVDRIRSVEHHEAQPVARRGAHRPLGQR